MYTKMLISPAILYVVKDAGISCSIYAKMLISPAVV
jgi:hypothetical protein